MDFRPTEASSDLTGLARDIAAKISTPERIAELETSGAAVDEQLWRALADAGLLALEATEDAGGAGLGAAENVAVAEELGRHLAVVPFGPHSIAALPAVAAAGGALADRWLSGMCDGTTVVTVAIDDELADDPLAPTTSARRDGDRWVIDGCKVSVPFAETAAAVIVTASSDDGLVALVVPTDAPGVTISAARTTGLVPTALIEFADVTLGDDAVVGRREAVVALVDRMTLAQCAEQAGVVAGALDLTAAYGRERTQFGRPIGSFQAVAQRLADAYIDVRAAKLTVVQAAYLVGEGLPAETELATAKFWAADAGHRVAHTAVHVHGGVGIDTSHQLHRYFLRAKQNEFALGSATAALRRIGHVLAAEPA
ncbi:MAG: acyl-CoA dehydrogenase [Corynebacteriales bacterium]|nr:acyl-CoA dehydrogenase [Mycobacteriales bacterium]